MIDYIINILFVIFLPVIVFMIVWVWVLVFDGIGDWLFSKINPEKPPYCDIDPLNHASFVRDKHGIATINGHKVKQAEK